MRLAELRWLGLAGLMRRVRAGLFAIIAAAVLIAIACSSDNSASQTSTPSSSVSPSSSASPSLTSSASANIDVMGYHDQREIPNYWQYAEQFVLQDKMFEPNASWSLPEHLFMVSGWSAKCSTSDPLSCKSALQSPDQVGKAGVTAPNY